MRGAKKAPALKLLSQGQQGAAAILLKPRAKLDWARKGDFCLSNVIVVFNHHKDILICSLGAPPPRVSAQAKLDCVGHGLARMRRLPSIIPASRRARMMARSTSAKAPLAGLFCVF